MPGSRCGSRGEGDPGRSHLAERRAPRREPPAAPRVRRWRDDRLRIAVCWPGRSVAGSGDAMPQIRPTAAAALLVVCGLAAATSPATAHVTLEAQQAQAGAAY